MAKPEAALWFNNGIFCFLVWYNRKTTRWC